MQAFTTVLLLCLGALSTTSASTSDNIVQDGLESLPEDTLRHIGSLLPVLDRVRFSLTSPDLRSAVVLNDAEKLAAGLIRNFAKNKCLLVAFYIDGAPPGFIGQVVTELLRSTEFSDLYVREALRQAYYVGHCDLIDVLSDYRQHKFFGQPSIDRASCAKVTRLAALPLQTLLKKHALPKHTFFQVLAAKYSRSGYASFFKNPAWYSQYCSNTVLSYALELYEKLNKSIDFEPVPFGRIASTQTISAQTQKILLDMSSSCCTDCRLRREGLCDRCFFTFSYLQSVLSPGSEIQFFNSTSFVFRTEFLVTACKTGRLDWVKFMVEHELWRDVKVPIPYFHYLRWGWGFFNCVMRYVDVLPVCDPVVSAFGLVFHHQMNLLSSSESQKLCTALLNSHISGSSKKIIVGYTTAASNSGLIE